MKEFIDKNLESNRLMAITDVVWNHTADNTPWLKEHPEAGYASTSSLHLAMAFEVHCARYSSSELLLTLFIAR